MLLLFIILYEDEKSIIDKFAVALKVKFLIIQEKKNIYMHSHIISSMLSFYSASTEEVAQMETQKAFFYPLLFEEHYLIKVDLNMIVGDSLCTS